MVWVFTIVSKLFGFVNRHRWSVPLAALSTAVFVHLALEVRDGELDAVDAAVARAVTALRGRVDYPMLALTYFGKGLCLAAVTALAVVVMLVVRRRREAFFLAACGIGTGLLNAGLKLAFHRARPDATLDYLIESPSSFSFPSGHAMGSMGVLVSIVVALRVCRVPRAIWIVVTALVAVLVMGIGVSRIYFGVHYPSDVLAGQLAGAAWVSAMTGWFYPRLLPGEEAEEPAPVSSSGQTT